MLSALGVHSLIETATLGIQSSSRSAWLLAASIGLHQPAESVALLVALLKGGLTRKQIILLLSGFTALGPVGLTLGIAARSMSSGAFESVLVALTAGTFIYVGATEVIAEEFEGSELKRTKTIALLAGMAAIFGVVAVTEKLEASALG